jgi:dihydropteroate synthase
MGILNVTPDSFSDGGRSFAFENAVLNALALVEEGADILDIGGESTRPGHAPVDLETELARVGPVLDALAGRVSVPISIDTTKRAVAEFALQRGARILNDVWGLKREPALAGLAADSGADLVLMHNRDAVDPDIDIVADVVRFLEGSVAIARAAGVPDASIVLDPGMGFGKTPAQSLEVVRRLDAVRALGFRVLLGVSRKRTIGLLTGRAVDQRLPGTLAMNVCAMRDGVDIIRVHDVAAHVDARRIVEALGALPAPLLAS